MDSSDSKRILYIITKASWGGAQRYVFDLAVSMRKHGHAVTVAFGGTGALVDKLEQAGIRTVPLPSLSRDFNFKNEWRAYLHLLALLKRERPDIVHVNSSKAGLALLASRFVRIPLIIFTAHAWAFNEARPWWQKIILRVVYAITIILSHKTICVSDAIYRDMSHVPLIAKRLFVVRHGIDAPTFKKKEIARSFFGEHKNRVWLGMLAELHPTKRIPDAIRALCELKESHPELLLVVLGEGEKRNELEELIASCDLEDHVLLPGFVADAATYLSAFDIFLMPSRSEALGYALVEAGYAGLPSIVSRAGGMTEIVRHKDTGLLVPAENHHALARAIRKLLDNPDYAKELGRKLQEKTVERFSKKRMLAETAVIYFGKKEEAPKSL